MLKATQAPSPHAEAAKALIDKIRAHREEIPHFTTEGAGDGRSLNGGNVPEPFVESASAAIQQSTRFESAAGADATTLRDAYAYTIAYEPVVQEYLAMAAFLAHSIRVKRDEAGKAALDVLAHGTRICKRKGNEDLKPYVDDMRRKLKKSGRPRKASSDPVTPAPVPVPPAAPVVPAAPDTKPKA